MPVEIRTETDHPTGIEKAFLENHEVVYRAAYHITANASDAEDVLQTLFLRLVRRELLPDFKCGWPAYLHRSAVHIALDVVRARARQGPLGDRELMLQDNRPDPHREHAAAELQQEFRRALAELNPNAAEIFILYYVEGYKLREIAGLVNSTKSAVAVTLFRARSRLRKSMSKFLGGR